MLPPTDHTVQTTLAKFRTDRCDAKLAANPQLVQNAKNQKAPFISNRIVSKVLLGLRSNRGGGASGWRNGFLMACMEHAGAMRQLRVWCNTVARGDVQETTRRWLTSSICTPLYKGDPITNADVRPILCAEPLLHLPSSCLLDMLQHKLVSEMITRNQHACCSGRSAIGLATQLQEQVGALSRETNTDNSASG